MGNLPASIRRRLLNRARNEHRPFNELLQYYAMERFLYRLARSDHASRFILKGALSLRVRSSSDHSDPLQLRPTMDIDLLGRTSNQETAIVDQIKDILSAPVPADGLVFDPHSIRTERITEDADYEDLRIRFLAMLDSARVNMQIDIGFGDSVYPGPQYACLPTILDHPPPKLLCYSRENTIAEKLEIMVKLGPSTAA